MGKDISSICIATEWKENKDEGFSYFGCVIFLEISSASINQRFGKWPHESFLHLEFRSPKSVFLLLFFFKWGFLIWIFQYTCLAEMMPVSSGTMKKSTEFESQTSLHTRPSSTRSNIKENEHVFILNGRPSPSGASPRQNIRGKINHRRIFYSRLWKKSSGRSSRSILLQRDLLPLGEAADGG